MSVFTQQHSIKRRFKLLYHTEWLSNLVCVWSRERVVQQASIALSAGDFQLMFMRNSIKLLGSFRMVVGKPAGLRHLLRRRRRWAKREREDDDRHNIIPKCSLRPLFDSHLLPPLRFSLRATKPYERNNRKTLCVILLYMLTPVIVVVDKHADSLLHMYRTPVSLILLVNRLVNVAVKS